MLLLIERVYVGVTDPGRRNGREETACLLEELSAIDQRGVRSTPSNQTKKAQDNVAALCRCDGEFLRSLDRLTAHFENVESAPGTAVRYLAGTIDEVIVVTR